MELYIPTTQNAEQSFHKVADWAKNAALAKRKHSKHDPNSKEAIELYESTVDCIAQMWLCIVNSHPEARIIFGDALDRAEEFDKKEKSNG